MPNPVTFIHKNGRVIPIRSSNGAAEALRAPVSAPGTAIKAVAKQTAGAVNEGAVKPAVAQLSGAVSALHNAGNRVVSHVENGLTAVGLAPTIHVNHRLDMLSLGLSVGTGILGAATFSSPKKFVAGLAATKAIDAVGTAANVASVAGRGFHKERAKQAIRQEARNFVVGNAVYAAGILGFKGNRAAGKAALKITGQKIVSVAKRVFG